MQPPNEQPEKLAPNSPEAEEGVLGSILYDKEALHVVRPILSENDFFIVRNGWIYAAMLDIDQRGDAIDNLTVIEALRQREQLDQVGGSAYILYLVNQTPTARHAETYAHMVERAAIRRRLLAAASDIAQTALEENAEIDDVISHAESTLFGVTERRRSADLLPIGEAVSQHYAETERRYAHRGDLLGISTGYHQLDKMLSGLQAGSLYLVAARPGVGKSSFMFNVIVNGCQWAERQAEPRRLKVAIFSLEMSTNQVVTKLAALATMHPLDTMAIQHGDLDDTGWSHYTDATAALSRYGLFIDDTPTISVLEVWSKCRALQRAHGLDLVVVDYLQLMVGERRSENRVQEVSYISRHLKVMAKDLHVPVLTASQLNRMSEQREDKHPKLHDLRDSGSLEQDADAVIGLYRDDMVNDASERPNQLDAEVLKNRMGPTGMDILYFRRSEQRILNMTRSTIDVRPGSNGYHHDESDDDGDR